MLNGIIHVHILENQLLLPKNYRVDMGLAAHIFVIPYIWNGLHTLQFLFWIVSFLFLLISFHFIPEELLRNSYLCSECGFAFPSLAELREHLLLKTAWSNNSLIGCRISCLLDNKEWHEGIVTQFHKSGKHSVEFRSIGEKRWLPMSKMAFYILERNQEQTAEYKENEESTSPSNVIADQSDSDRWNYIEDISIEFAFAQSVLFKVYGGVVQETGHKTRGHLSLTEQDRSGAGQYLQLYSDLNCREVARSMKGSLLYGELLARGVNKV
jgi:hypothetical protein